MASNFFTTQVEKILYKKFEGIFDIMKIEVIITVTFE